jgi:hypothetical protein
MFGPKVVRGSFVVAVACLAILVDGPGTAPAQQGPAPKKTRAKRLRAKKPVAKSSPRPKGETEAKTVADRIVLRDGKELLGQVDESSSDGMLTTRTGTKNASELGYKVGGRRDSSQCNGGQTAPGTACRLASRTPARGSAGRPDYRLARS